MTRLLVRDAARRYGAGVGIAILPLAYLWRSLPPRVVREWLWALPPDRCAVVVGVALAVVVLVTLPIARTLVASRRLEYWRQFAIAPAQWQALTRRHLAFLNLPVLCGTAYFLAPVDHLPLIGAGSLAAWAIAIAGHESCLRRWPDRSRVIGLPTGAGPVTALARLDLLVLVRRQRGAVVVSVALQCALVSLAGLGWVHVAAVEPSSVTPLLRTLVVLAALAGAWPLLVAQRALDRDRWWLDAAGIDAHTELAARLLAGAVLGSVTIVGVVLAGIAASDPSAAPAFAATALGWATAAVIRIGARAESRRDLPAARAGSIAWRAVYGLSLVHLLHPAALAVAALLEGLAGWRSLRHARRVRARFETSTVEDDHD